jgi:hypothetical protein
MTPNQRDAVRAVVAALEQLVHEVEVGEAEVTRVMNARADVAYELQRHVEALRELLPSDPA